MQGVLNLPLEQTQFLLPLCYIGSKRQMSSCPSFWLQLLSFPIPPCKTPYPCVYACQCVLERLFTFLSPFLLFMCASHPSLQLCETSCVCVYSTWLTCSRRAGCQQQSHHFTSTLSDPHHCQEDCMSASKYTDTGCTAKSLLVEVRVYGFVSMVCACGAICSISLKLYLTSCACWLYLCPSPGLPAPGEWAASRRTVTQHQLCQTQKRLRNWDKQSLPLCFCCRSSSVLFCCCFFCCICLWTQNLDCGLEITI